MADRWLLVTPYGDYQLNASFSAPQLHPGGVDTGAVLRRDGRQTYQRSGDGLRTPGPLVLTGRVWRDDQDVAAIVDELDQIQEAVGTCVTVRRVNDAGTVSYHDIAGGPPPAYTPDGLGGWEVTIELWPGRPEPSFIPLPAGSHLYIVYDTSGSMSSESLTALRAAIDDVTTALEGGGVPAENIHETDSSQERYLQWMVQARESYVVIAFVNEAAPSYHTLTDTGPTAAWTADYNALRSHLDGGGVQRFRALIYALGPSSAASVPEYVAAFNDLHIPRAVPGTDGYPNAPSLAGLGVSYRVNVLPEQPASVYLDDIWTALGG